MNRATFVWKNRRLLWKYRRPLRSLWKHRYAVIAATGAGIGFVGARAVNRAIGR